MKRLLSIFLAVILSAGVFSTSVFSVNADEIATEHLPIQRVFTDIEPGSELEVTLARLKNAGIINGYEDGSFHPEGELSRAEFCKMVNILFGYTVKDTTSFPDVTADLWYYDHVLIAKKSGYILGFEDGTFRGNEKITREQVCVILDRVLGCYKLYDVAITDEVSDWSRLSVEKIISNGFMPLEENSTFRAKQNITRAEFANLFIIFLNAKTENNNKDDDKNNTTIPPTGGTPTPKPPAGGGDDDEGGNTNPPAGGDDDEGGNTNPPAGDDDDEGGNTNPPAGDDDDEGGNTNPPAGDDDDEGGNTNPPEEEVDMTEDDIVIAEMAKLLADLDSRYRFTHPQEFFPFYEKLKNVLRSIITDSETILITPEYVNEEYGDQMEEFKSDYKNLCDHCVGEFNAIVNDCATKYKAILVDYFYDIIPEEAFDMLG